MKKVFINTRLLMILVSILFVAVSMSGSTYALYVKKDMGNATESYETGQLELTFEENDTFTLTNDLPITDADGEASRPYSLTIKNTGNLTYTFDLLLLNTTASNQISNQYIKIKVDDDAITSLATSNVLKSNITLVPGQYKRIEIRIWLDYNTPNSEIGKIFSAKATTNGRSSYTTGTETFTKFSQYIMALSQGNSWEAGATGVYATDSYVDDNDGITKYHSYRYVGAEPDNYVKFNNDMYQIIGVFDDDSHGITGDSQNINDKYLVKLISANVLGGYSWGIHNSSNTSGAYSGNYSNDWTGNAHNTPANLNILLNEYFYNKTYGSNTYPYGLCSNWTYYYSTTDYRTNNCSNIVGYGIDPNIKSYIEANATWHLSGSDTNQSKQDWYACERGGNGCVGGNNGAYATTTTKPIGLMYISDYLYASSYYTSSDTTDNFQYYFGNNNWLYKGYEWTMTPCSSRSNRGWSIDYGIVNNYNLNSPSGARPVFYLKSNIQMKRGNGTFDNPYILE